MCVYERSMCVCARNTTHLGDAAVALRLVLDGRRFTQERVLAALNSAIFVLLTGLGLQEKKLLRR